MLAVLGLVIFGLMQLLTYRMYSQVMKGLAMSEGQRGWESLQPLLERSFVIGTAFFCGIFGAVLGWLQIHNERRPDLWAFLMHRPLTRTQVFLGKTVAGLGLYAVVAGLPLLGLITWAAAPGDVAAPMEWGMVKPVAALFLSGIVYYFAGMLTGLRQARWYASRAFGLGVAFIVTAAMVGRPHFAGALFVIALGGAILATAVWGAFQSHGYSVGQPAAGKAALTLSLALGSMVVLFIGGGLVDNFLPEPVEAVSWSSYGMTQEGTLYRLTRGTRMTPEIVDLEGRPVTNAKTGRPLELAELERHAPQRITVSLDADRGGRNQGWVSRSYQRFAFWQRSRDTLWYYWIRYGRLAGYDIHSRRLVGSLGPGGFARDLIGSGDRFDSASSGGRTFHTATNICQVDFEKRTTQTLFTTTPNDPILASTDVILNSYDWDYSLVVTRRFVHLLTPAGKEVWEAPFQPNEPAYTSVELWVLEAPGRFALWIGPRQSDEKAHGLPTRVVWVASEQGVLKTADLAPLPAPAQGPRLGEKVMACVSPPALFLLFPWLEAQPRLLPWNLLLLSVVIAAVVCVPVSWWLGSRYNLSLGARLGWAGFNLVAGVPGLVAFICEEEWPAREPCPGCKKLRVVDREQCEHCGAAFAAPERTGIEILEPLTGRI